MAAMLTVAWISQVIRSLFKKMPIMLELATRRSPNDIKTIMKRDFVLTSGHRQNVIIIVKDPRIESDAAVVDKI